MVLNSKYYDFLKKVAMIYLPLFVVAYLGLGEVWHWPENEKVAASAAIVNTLLGGLLQASSNKYKSSGELMDGYLAVTGYSELGVPSMALTVTSPPDVLEKKGVAMLKIGTAPVPPPSVPLEVDADQQPTTDEP